MLAVCGLPSPAKKKRDKVLGGRHLQELKEEPIKPWPVTEGRKDRQAVLVDRALGLELS